GDPYISDEQLMEAIDKVGLSQFIKESKKGLDTILYPEGKQISFTISKKIVLARAIVSKPKLLILEDPLEHFEIKETNRIIAYLTDSKNPWALVVVSQNKEWSKNCSEIIILKEGKLK
ncbi:MAG: ABC transporter ATP-binding protein, partial [Winogradskyella sp.]|nr:ABC transporter ATP-binding protein [Winogradskyella sp.]